MKTFMVYMMIAWLHSRMKEIGHDKGSSIAASRCCEDVDVFLGEFESLVQTKVISTILARYRVA